MSVTNQARKKYWNDAWSLSLRFKSLKPTNELPWDIHTFDKNLQESLKLLHLDKGKVLEIGCGSGYDSKFLNDIGFDVTSIDISEISIKIAKKNNQGNNVNFIVGDIEFDIPNEKYDLIYDRSCLNNCQDKLFQIFEKLSSVLNVGGKIISIAGNINQTERETVKPSPMSIGYLEHNCYKWFKIILVKEIIFELHPDYGNCLGNLFILEKK